MAPSNLSIWVDRNWLALSQQLMYAYQIDPSNFKDGLLIKETPNGQWLHSWLVRAWHEYSPTAREASMIRIVPPNGPDNLHSIMLDITIRRHEATITAKFPTPFGAITPAAAATTAVTSTTAAPTTSAPTTEASTMTATAGPSSTVADPDDVPGPSSSSKGKGPARG